MSVNLQPHKHHKHLLDQSEWDIDEMVEAVMAFPDISVAKATVRQMVITLLARFIDAPVKTYVPVLVHREAVELLRRAPMEIEAKFTVPAPGIFWQLQTAEQLAGYTLSTQDSRNLRDTYLDTAKRQILASGYSCRRRRLPDGILMTLKSLGEATGAVHRRQEFEVALLRPLPPAKWPDSPARERVLQLSELEPLTPLFELEQTRIIRMVQQDGQTLAELSLDRVSLVSEGKELVYHELEVELLPTVSEQVLAEIVDCLQNEWHLQPEPLSKFERALNLLANQIGDTKIDYQSLQQSVSESRSRTARRL